MFPVTFAQVRHLIAMISTVNINVFFSNCQVFMLTSANRLVVLGKHTLNKNIILGE